MTKYLAIVFLITGFLVGDAYGEEDTAKSVKKIMEELERLRKLPPPVPEDLPWSEQKAKEFGFPAVAVGTTTMCEGMKSVGFNWEKGEYISKNFKVGKELYKKVEPDKYCLGWKRLTAEEKLGFIRPYKTTYFDKLGIREGCYTVYPFGEKPELTSTVCTERYEKKTGKNWETTISCDSTVTLKGDTSFSPNGLFHRFNTHSNLSITDESKFSLFIEWGKCATLFSP